MSNCSFYHRPRRANALLLHPRLTSSSAKRNEFSLIASVPSERTKAVPLNLQLYRALVTVQFTIRALWMRASCEGGGGKFDESRCWLPARVSFNPTPSHLLTQGKQTNPHPPPHPTLQPRRNRVSLSLASSLTFFESAARGSHENHESFAVASKRVRERHSVQAMSPRKKEKTVDRGPAFLSRRALDRYSFGPERGRTACETSPS